MALASLQEIKAEVKTKGFASIFFKKDREVFEAKITQRELDGIDKIIFDNGCNGCNDFGYSSTSFGIKNIARHIKAKQIQMNY